MEDGSWMIEFRRAQSQNAEDFHAHHPAQGSSSQRDQEIRLDLRGLEPPQPLVQALETLQQLMKGKKLIVHTDRKPMHLFDELNQRGFQYDCSEQADHSFITEIWHPYDPSNHAACAGH